MSIARLFGYAAIAAIVSLPALGLDSYSQMEEIEPPGRSGAQDAGPNALPEAKRLPAIIVTKDASAAARAPGTPEYQAMSYLVAGRVAENRGQDPDRIVRSADPGK